MIRPGWDEWALGIAKAVSTRGDCTRRQVGAVILDVDHGPVSFGYNGTRPGAEGCLDGACPRGRHYERKGETGWGWCACGNAWPCPDAVAPGSSYDTGPGACIGVHAEINAIFSADKSLLRQATIYITHAPCDGCKKLLRNTPIRRVVWPEGEYVHGE
jgi:dCMP deaminase